MYKKVKTIEEIPKDAVIFKHSITCGVSSMAKAEVDKLIDKHDIYLIIIQEQRDLSKEIAEKFNIKHESPQFIILKGKDKKVLNHLDITAENIKDYLI